MKWMIDSSWFVQDFLGFSSESPASQESPQSLGNQNGCLITQEM